MRLTKEELTSKLNARIARETREFSTKTVHLIGRAIPPKTPLRIGPDVHEVASEAFLVIIDGAPGAFWTHPVRYEFHDVDTGAVHAIDTKYPLEAPEFADDIVAIHIPDLPHLQRKRGPGFFSGPAPRPEELEAKFLTTSFDPPEGDATHRWALFACGMDNMLHFHNDFLRMRNLLIERYGYDPARIAISMGAPSAYPDLPVDYPGTVAGLDAALQSYAPGGARALGAQDSLFLYTFDHGDTVAGESVLCMAPAWDHYSATRMKTKLDAIHCGHLIVAMNQCRSGGFIPNVLASTGPASIAIMTACSAEQNAYASDCSSAGGYFSGSLMAALNWGFPASLPADFPGYAVGDIAWHDANGDGLICAEDGWNFVHDEMHAHHYATISGWETPQWGVSAAGVGTNLFWGKPDLRVLDSAAPAWWESPDIVLLDPAATPTDANTVPGAPAYWGDNYHPDVANRVVARVHNFGCAPARNVTVEFRVMSFGAGGGTSLIGTDNIPNINPGHHQYGKTDWNFPSALIHRCAMARATNTADPAMPFGAGMLLDDNQAQRNLDPAFAAPFTAQVKAPVIEKIFLITNTLDKPAVFAVVPTGRKEARWIKAVMPDGENLAELKLKPGEKRKLKVALQLRDAAELGEKFRLPIEVKRISPEPLALGGVTLQVEIAVGRLEGVLVAHEGHRILEGAISLANIKQPDLVYKARVDRKGQFSFKDIVPGPYSMIVDCPEGHGQDSVFVEPNRTTRKVVRLEPQHIWIGKLLAAEVEHAETAKAR